MKGILKAIIWFIVGLELLLLMFVMFSKFLEPEDVDVNLSEEEEQEIKDIIMPTFTKEEIPEEVYRRIYNHSFRENENITLEDLNYLRITYYDFEGKKHIGEMIVNKKIADDTLSVFKELYDIKYPINNMVLIDEYDADDEKSMKANNSSAFNYRYKTNKNELSNHALGFAIDINPLQNPYVENGIADPKEGTSYINRNLNKMGMILSDDECVRIFKKYGFEWGGDWITPKDYMHFEKIVE